MEEVYQVIGKYVLQGLIRKGTKFLLRVELPNFKFIWLSRKRGYYAPSNSIRLCNSNRAVIRMSNLSSSLYSFFVLAFWNIFQIYVGVFLS